MTGYHKTDRKPLPDCYDKDLHCRPIREDGTWYAIVRIKARPDATVSEVRQAIAEGGVEIHTEGDMNDVVQGATMMEGLTPDGGYDPDCGPVVYWP